MSQLADSPKATSGNLPSNDEGAPGGILNSVLAASAPMATPVVSVKRLTIAGISAIRSFVCEENSPMPVITEHQLLEEPVEKLSEAIALASSIPEPQGSPRCWADYPVNPEPISALSNDEDLLMRELGEQTERLVMQSLP